MRSLTFWFPNGFVLFICLFDTKAIAQCSDVLSLNPADSEKRAIVTEQQQVVSNSIYICEVITTDYKTQIHFIPVPFIHSNTIVVLFCS